MKKSFPWLELRNTTRNTLLVTRGWVANTLVTRVVGLLRHDSLEPGQGLYITPCTSIHSFGMKFIFDAAFVDRKGRVLHLISEMQPGGLSRTVWGARGVWELPAGTLKKTRTEPGDILQVTELPID